MKENKQKERDEDCEEMTDRKGTQQQQQRLRSLLSTTVVASRRTLHSKVSTQRACCERERMVEVPPPSASWSPPHHSSQPACRQLHPSNLLLSTTFSRKTASHYPEQGVHADGQTPGQSNGFLV